MKPDKRPEVTHDVQPQSRDVAVAYGVKWHRLNRPKWWKAAEAGDEIIGYYLGQSLRDGKFGQYTVVMLAVPTGQGFTQPYTISGTALISAIDGAQVEEGSLIRIVYQGIKDLDDDRHMKLFDVYLGEAMLDEGIAADLFNNLQSDPMQQRRCSHCHQTGHNRRTCPEADHD